LAGGAPEAVAVTARGVAVVVVERHAAAGVERAGEVIEVVAAEATADVAVVAPAAHAAEVDAAPFERSRRAHRHLIGELAATRRGRAAAARPVPGAVHDAAAEPVAAAIDAERPHRRLAVAVLRRAPRACDRFAAAAVLGRR